MIEHVRTDTDFGIYRSISLLPISLITKEGPDKRCVLLKFIPYCPPTAYDSTSRAFELASLDELPVLDTLVLLPSTLTTILDGTNSCSTCDNQKQTRVWSYFHSKATKSDWGISKQHVLSPYHPTLRAGVKPFE